MCGVDCFCRAPPSTCILMFWFNQDISGWGVCFLQPMTARRWGFEWIKHSDWTPFRLKKIMDADRFWLSPVFKHWRRDWGWRATWSWPAFCCQTLAVTFLACLIIGFSIKTNVIFLRSLLCRYKQHKYTLQYFWWRWAQEEGRNLNVLFTSCDEQMLLIPPLICVPDLQSTYRNTLVIPHTYLSYCYFPSTRFQCVT